MKKKKKEKISLQIRTCGGRDIDVRSRPRLVGCEVATRNGRRDLAGMATGLEALRGDLMLRHHFEVATWVAAKEVVTWKGTSRPG